MAQHLSDAGVVVRDGSPVVGDFALYVHLSPLVALEHEHGGKGFSEIADDVRSVRPGRDPRFDVREPESSFPDDRSILDQDARQPRDARSLPEQLDIALERGGAEIETPLLPGRHDRGHCSGEDQPGKDPARDAHRLSLTEAPRG